MGPKNVSEQLLVDVGVNPRDKFETWSMEKIPCQTEKQSHPGKCEMQCTHGITLHMRAKGKT